MLHYLESIFYEFKLRAYLFLEYFNYYYILIDILCLYIINIYYLKFIM